MKMLTTSRPQGRKGSLSSRDSAAGARPCGGGGRPGTEFGPRMSPSSWQHLQTAVGAARGGRGGCVVCTPSHRCIPFPHVASSTASELTFASHAHSGCCCSTSLLLSLMGAGYLPAQLRPLCPAYQLQHEGSSRDFLPLSRFSGAYFWPRGLEGALMLPKGLSCARHEVWLTETLATVDIEKARVPFVRCAAWQGCPDRKI